MECIRENDELKMKLKELTKFDNAEPLTRNLYTNSKIISMELDRLQEHLI